MSNENKSATAPKNISVQVEVNEGHLTTLERAFPDLDSRFVSRTIARFAFQEWIDWLAGNKRYMTITDQSIERVISMYAELLPEKEPEVGYLYNRFNITYGRSRYIVQAIVERQLHDLNARALKQLIDIIDKKLQEYESFPDEEKMGLSEIVFDINVRAARILTSAINELPTEEGLVFSFKNQPSSLPDRRICKLSPDDLKPVLEALEALQKEFTRS